MKKKCLYYILIFFLIHCALLLNKKIIKFYINYKWINKKVFLYFKNFFYLYFDKINKILKTLIVNSNFTREKSGFINRIILRYKNLIKLKNKLTFIENQIHYRKYFFTSETIFIFC